MLQRHILYFEHRYSCIASVLKLLFPPFLVVLYFFVFEIYDPRKILTNELFRRVDTMEQSAKNVAREEQYLVLFSEIPMLRISGKRE